MGLKFKKGDPVRFLNDTGGGVISSISPEGLIFVQTDDGFEIPVPAKELVHAGSFELPDQDRPETSGPFQTPPKTVAPEKTQTPVAAELPAKQELPQNISPDARVHLLLGIIPDNPGPVFNSELAIYLINDSPYFAYYSVGSWERGIYFHLSSGMIESDTKNLISVLDQTAMSKISGIHIQGIWLGGGRYNRKQPIDELVDIQMINFSKESYYHESAYFNEKAILLSLTGRDEQSDHMGKTIPDTIKLEKGDSVSFDPVPKKQDNKTDTMEIDLHMDETDLQRSQFSFSGILALQMSRFHAALEEAVSKKFKRLVIIHGVGQGTLKMQIRKELQEKYPGYIFQDASFREYGFGATMVHLNTDKKQ
jgi:hypothetical protein